MILFHLQGQELLRENDEQIKAQEMCVKHNF